MACDLRADPHIRATHSQMPGTANNLVTLFDRGGTVQDAIDVAMHSNLPRGSEEKLGLET
jgi:hypothetical protein